MGDDQAGAPGQQVVQGYLDVLFCGGVHARRGLVEDQHRRVLKQSAGNREPLPLPGAEPDPALADLGVPPVREGLHKIPSTSSLENALHLGIRSPGPTQLKIFPNRCLKEKGLLGHNPHLPADFLQGDLPQRNAVHQDFARGRIMKARHEGGEGGLAGSGRPHQRKGRSPRHGEIDPVQNLAPAPVGKLDVGEPHFPGQALAGREVLERQGRGVTGLGLSIENGKDAFPGRAPGLNQLIETMESSDRLIKHPDIKKKGHQLPDRHSLLQHRPSPKPKNETAPDRGDKGHGGIVKGPCPHDFQGGGTNLLGGPFKAFGPFAEPAVGLDLPDALKMVHQQRVEGGGGFALHAVPRVGCDGVPKRAGRQKGDGSQGPSGQVGVEPEKDDAHPQDLDEGHETLFDPVDEHPLHVGDILANASQKIAAGTVVVPGNRKFLEGGIEITPEVENDPLLEKVVEQNAKGVEPVPTEKNQSQKPDQPRKTVTQALGNDIVDQVTREPRENQAKKGGEQGRCQGPHRKAGIFPKVTGNAKSDGHGDGTLQDQAGAGRWAARL